MIEGFYITYGSVLLLMLLEFSFDYFGFKPLGSKYANVCNYYFFLNKRKPDFEVGVYLLRLTV